MFKFLLLFLTLSGLQAVPIAVLRGLQKTSSTYQLPDGFRQGTEHTDVRKPIPDGFHQGTEPSRNFLVDLNTGLVRKRIGEMSRRVGSMQLSPAKGFGEMERRHWLTDEVPVDVPTLKNAGGWVRVDEPSVPHLQDGFRQGTEPIKTIPEGFRQGTEPIRTMPEGFRQGTEPIRAIPESFRQGTKLVKSSPDSFRQRTEPIKTVSDGFRQGTEPIRTIPEGFRQGTEPIRAIPESFRQGTKLVKSSPDSFRQRTEPIRTIPEGFRQGTEPIRTIPEGFRQGTEPIRAIPEGFRKAPEPSTCEGEVINGNCYEFNPTLLAFQDAQALCRSLAPNAELASVTTGDLQSRLVYLVTQGGERNPVLTWLGGRVQNQQPSWVDGSEWRYSEWMPGHPNLHTDKPVCVEMFKMGESWWTAADCELKRASICSYQITA
uniref:C-type lectin domain-containing protein n=1 Tax=Gasterosteus aculeatus aculeatus TaxID=481459 RepID=A0AAQ4QYU9_GASAC